MEIETKRLTLAPPKPGDGAALLPIRNSSYVLERNAAPALPLEKLEQQLAQEAASHSAFLLWERDTGALAGGFGWRPTGFATRCPPRAGILPGRKFFRERLHD